MVPFVNEGEMLQGPQPPKLDANFEDHAMYAIKSSILKESLSVARQ